MAIKFAELEVYISAEDDVVISQFCFGDDDQIISFPRHQAKAICAAILETAKSGK